jgi:ADP-heptose:LPS heptosyltransferase
MLNPNIKRPSNHELMAFKIKQKQENRMTPNADSRTLPPLAALERYIAGEKLKICIVRSKGGIGDVLMTTPTLKAIKQRYPNSELTYATDPRYSNGDLVAILKNNPYIDNIVAFTTVNKNQFHFVCDLTSTGLAQERPGLPPINRIDMFAKEAGVPLLDKKPTYIVEPDERQWAQDQLIKWGASGKRIITLHSSSVDERRNWPAKQQLELISRLTAAHKDIFFIIFDQHHKGLGSLKNSFDASSFDIRAKAALIDASHLFVGPDSGLLHIAGALEKPIVSLFGSTYPEARINHYINAVSIESETFKCQCRWYKACSNQYQCMTSIKVSKVIEIIENKLLEDKGLTVGINTTITVASHLALGLSATLIDNSLINCLRLSAVPIFDGTESVVRKNMDYWIETVDMDNITNRRNKKLKAIGYIVRGNADIDPGKRAALNSFSLLIVPSSILKDKLVGQGITTKMYVIPLPLVPDPKPKSIESVGRKTHILLTGLDSAAHLPNLKSLLQTFKDTWPNDLDKRLLIMTSPILSPLVSSTVLEYGDIRTSISVASSPIKVIEVFNQADLYIELDPLAWSNYQCLYAMSRGINVIHPKTECFKNLSTMSLKALINEDGCLDRDSLRTALEAPLNEPSDLIDYVRTNYNPKSIAHQLITIVKEEVNARK